MEPIVTIPIIAEIGLVTSRSVVAQNRPPLPSEFVAVFVFAGMTALVSTWNPRVGAAFGWGIVIATALNVLPGVVPKQQPAGGT